MKINKHFYALLILCLPLSLLAQVQVTKAYIEKYKGIAMQEMKRTGIPASITLAQAIVESSSGESNLAKKFNNHFGIKCKSDWKGETTYQDDDTKKECFRVYSDALNSFKDHSDFLKNRPNYASLFELDPVDDSAWAIGLKKAGYATASDYPKKLLKVIDDYELSQYNYPNLVTEEDTVVEKTDTIKTTKPQVVHVKDTLATKASPVATPELKQDSVQLSGVNGISDSHTSPKTTAPQAIKKISDLPKESIANNSAAVTVSTANSAAPATPTSPAPKKKTTIYPNTKFKINGVPVIWAEEGRSFLEIAATYNIPLYKLYLYNDLKEMDLVEKDQLIFLAAKHKENILDSTKKVNLNLLNNFNKKKNK
jgi:hypothetical protein